MAGGHAEGPLKLHNQIPGENVPFPTGFEGKTNALRVVYWGGVTLGVAVPIIAVVVQQSKA